tara:strand:- start:2341 stop:2646 length:306 start_codon:yes stop_codon:yes gene_type:complete
MSTGDPELDKKLDKLLKKLEKASTKDKKTVLKAVTLSGKGPHFYWSVQHRMFLEVPVPSELYWMVEKPPKEGKLYIFTPWVFNSGAVFLIPAEKVVKIGDN